MSNPGANTSLEGIAIIGMAGRFPKARNIAEFWRNLHDGVEAISLFSEEELIASGLDAKQVRDPNYVKAKGVLEDAELFDVSFFGFTPREAEIMDPQQRIFLECVWEALEVAGYASEKRTAVVGLFAGVSLNTYLFNLFSNPGFLESVGFFHMMLGNDRDYLATRVSYELNLKGPSLTVQSACSTSLVAVHLACQSLLDYHCDMALAGGVSVTAPVKSGYRYELGGIASPDGHCRAFDHRAQGTVNGNGVGVVLLKRLEDALADGDTINAVIKGSAINNDGSLKIGFTAPSVEGQAQVIAEAQAVAGVPAETVTYVETHGTGTALGDPIEVAALTQAFRAGTERKHFCAIGSVKTNIGHLDAAAGVTGLIKTVLALKHKQIPPSLHFERPNPNIDFAHSPFYVNDKLAQWSTANGIPRRAGVSSFGIGGTNAHVIVEEAPQAAPSTVSSRPYQLLLLSARTDTALTRATENLGQHLKANPKLNIADVAYTLQVGRGEFASRSAILCRDTEDAIEAFDGNSAKRVRRGKAEPGGFQLAMMFSGQGAQYVGMGRDLYRSEPTFHEQIERCAKILESHLGLSIRKLIFAAEADAAEEQLKQTAITQPALFVIEYALAQLWMGWGIKPSAMIGHSIGEYVAACLAGVFSLEDALRLVAARGRLMQSLPPGAMLSVPLAESELTTLLATRGNRDVSLAAINAPSLCVVSGTVEAVDSIQHELSERGVECRRLHTSHAFHSQMMEPVLREFTTEVRRLALHAPQIPYISNVTGRWITADEATDAAYWARHLREPVRFADGVGELVRSGKRVLLEVGPGQTLATLAKRQQPEDAAPCVLLSSLPSPHERQSDAAFLLQTLGQLWLAGANVNWPAFYSQEQRGRVPLPTYPFERERFWVDAQPDEDLRNRQQRKLGKKHEIADWFYVPVWKQSVALARFDARFETAQPRPQPRPCLIFADECGLGLRLFERLKEQGRSVTIVHAGTQFERVNASEYFIAPLQREHYDLLFQELHSQGRQPGIIAHLWNVTPDEEERSLSDEQFERSQQLGFNSLLLLAQSLGEQSLSHSINEQSPADALQVCVVSNNLQAVTGAETLRPERATLLGPCRVMAQEYSQITSRSIDITLPAPGSIHESLLLDQLLVQLIDELTSRSGDAVVAYRGPRRWVQSFEAIRVEHAESAVDPAETSTGQTVEEVLEDDGASVARKRLPPRLREHGVYLVTGGMGGIGLELAKHLARVASARLILVARNALPEREQWAAWIEQHGAEDATSIKIMKVQEVETLGAEVLPVAADVGDLSQMQEVLRLALARFGEIHGIIHAAGLPGGGFMQMIEPETIASTLRPKVQGTRVLETLLQNQPLDFLVLFSSHRSILGGLGRVDYCAANAYLDAFARAHPLKRSAFTCSIIWDGWQEVGMAVEAAQRLHIEPEKAIEEGMLNIEGVEAFTRALGQMWPEVIISTQDFPSLFEQSKMLSAAKMLDELNKVRRLQASHARPDLQTEYAAPTSEVEQTLAAIWEQLLGIDRVGIHDNFFELGGDSVLSIQIISKANKAGLHLTPQQIFQHQTIAELAAIAGTSRAIQAEQHIVTGPAPLTPIQSWFFEADQPHPHHYNQSLLLQVRETLDTALLEKALAHLLAHHDALRMRFSLDDSGWQQRNEPPEDFVPCSRLDLSATRESEQAAAIAASAGEAQSSLNLQDGPLVRVLLFDLGAGVPGRLLLVIHHLVIDAISWRVLLEDLATAYEQLVQGKPVSLPAKTTSFKSWAEQLHDFAQSQAVVRELDYWLDQKRLKLNRLPVDFADGRNANTEASARSFQVALSQEETGSLLHDVPKVYRTQINDVLAAALVQSFARWTGEQFVLVDFEGHGRDLEIENVDVTRTVGWFTTLYPVLLELEAGAHPGQALKHIKEELRNLPGRGAGYGLLRYMHEDATLKKRLREMPQAEVSFLYLGQMDQALPASSPFATASESTGLTSSPERSRSHLLSINGFVMGGELRLVWTYSENVHRPETIERLAQWYLESLRGLINYCLNSEAGGFTPSDFPDAELNQEDLDELLNELSHTHE
jgi:non-ribosomal peptide synthase protein (TIGR01720 family)